MYAASHRPWDFATSVVWQGADDDVVRQLLDLRPRGVIAGCESGVELAERIAPQVVPQLCNDPLLAGARRHKGDMAAAVARHGLPVIPQVTTSDAGEVAEWITTLPSHVVDLVIKPPKSASTDGVTRVGTRDWRGTFETILGSVNRLGLVNTELVVQQYVVGTEYVVDTFTFDGRHTVTDLCRYRKIPGGASVAVYDTMEWVDPADPVVNVLVTYASDVLTAVGLRFGAAHVEIMLTEDGPVLIELGARAHGGGQPRYCLMATGDSQIERTARYFAGLPETIPPSYRLDRQALVVFHLSQRTGRINTIAPLRKIDQLPTVVEAIHHYREGMQITPTSDLFSSLDLGFVVLMGSTKADLYRDYRRIRQLELTMLEAPSAHAS